MTVHNADVARVFDRLTDLWEIEGTRTVKGIASHACARLYPRIEAPLRTGDLMPDWFIPWLRSGRMLDLHHNAREMEPTR